MPNENVSLVSMPHSLIQRCSISVNAPSVPRLNLRLFLRAGAFRVPHISRYQSLSSASSSFTPTNSHPLPLQPWICLSALPLGFLPGTSSLSLSFFLSFARYSKAVMEHSNQRCKWNLFHIWNESPLLDLWVVVPRANRWIHQDSSSSLWRLMTNFLCLSVDRFRWRMREDHSAIPQDGLGRDGLPSGGGDGECELAYGDLIRHDRTGMKIFLPPFIAEVWFMKYTVIP